jgi:hypothetical protein
MAEPKTKETKESVSKFLAKIPNETRRQDCLAVVDIMRDVTGEEPKMWGTSIVGFGHYLQKYASGREAPWPITGFSPRKGDLTLYIMGGFESSADLMKRLGKFKTRGSCLHIKTMADVDAKVLRKVVANSVKLMSPKRIRK